MSLHRYSCLIGRDFPVHRALRCARRAQSPVYSPADASQSPPPAAAGSARVLRGKNARQPKLGFAYCRNGKRENERLDVELLVSFLLRLVITMLSRAKNAASAFCASLGTPLSYSSVTSARKRVSSFDFPRALVCLQYPDTCRQNGIEPRRKTGKLDRNRLQFQNPESRTGSPYRPEAAARSTHTPGAEALRMPDENARALERPLKHAHQIEVRKEYRVAPLFKQQPIHRTPLFRSNSARRIRRILCGSPAS